MSTQPGPEAKRIGITLELHEIGVYLYRQQLRRQYPRESEGQIDTRVRSWLCAPSEDWPRTPSHLTPEAVRAALAAAGLTGFNAYRIAADGLGTYIAVTGPGLLGAHAALMAAGYKAERVPPRLGEYLVVWGHGEV